MQGSGYYKDSGIHIMNKEMGEEMNSSENGRHCELEVLRLRKL